MAENSFFEISKEQSRVKADIVSKYFEAWANVMMGVQDRERGKYGDRIAYLDLFAGPGRYDDGTKSTPLMILERAIVSDKLRDRLVSIFNDKDENNTRSLQEAINKLPGIETLRYQPKVYSREVGTEIVKMFEQMRMIPTFFFVDPWGYKGLSLQLVNAVLKDWGCDCVFFFNYNRISMGLPNEMVEEHMNALFGKIRADNLREQIKGLPPDERELMIVEELCQAIKATGKKYVLPFRFKSDTGKRTSHHLIFVSKGSKGYEIMKEVMARESSTIAQGVAAFEYSSASIRQPLLFQLARPLDDLQGMLLERFAGRTMTLDTIYEHHNVDTPYIKKNYRDALLSLEAVGKIVTDPPIGKSRRKGTFGPKVKVTFPTKAQV
jgi:three-Cys-motif partner protein